MIRSNIANILTILRIVGSITLLSFNGITPGFIGVYTFCGLTDALDGFVARKLHTESDFGSKLDSVSDLTFYSVMMYKIWYRLKELLPDFVFVIIFTIAGIRVACYLYVLVVKKTFASEHFIMNKVTGFMMFLSPYLLNWDYFLYYAIAVCTVAVIAAANEFLFHLVGGKHDS